MVGYLSLEAGRWVAPLTQWDSAGSTYNTHDICDHPTWILQPSHKITNTQNANDTLLQATATHSLAHNTLPALQRLKHTFCVCPHCLFTQDSQCHSWKVLPPGKRSHIAKWEPALLPVFDSRQLSNQDFCGGSSLSQPHCHIQLLRPPMHQSELQWTLKKLCYMPLAPTHHLIVFPALLTVHIAQLSIPPLPSLAVYRKSTIS